MSLQEFHVPNEMSSIRMASLISVNGYCVLVLMRKRIILHNNNIFLEITPYDVFFYVTANICSCSIACY